jgi:predicted pyridoxine 5'-phosphate oxidase superfamily flavin-nucleotide-binding protein
MLRTNRISKDPSPYHVGEQHAQTRVGVRDIAERIGRAYIRKYLTDQAKEFYNELPFLNVGTR